MRRKLNAQYNLAAPDSMAVRVATRVRARIFATFMTEFNPTEADEMLDLGVTSDQSYKSSNLFEDLYPYKNRITAAGVDDGSFLENIYPGVRFQFADALNLPFEVNTFDYVHSSAVLEHVGSYANQRRMVAECLRVARKGVCLTTPNRWFPIEVHTQLPLVHWLPKSWFRAFLGWIGHHELATEANLNLMTEGELRKITALHPDWSFHFRSGHWLGLKSNAVLFAAKKTARTRPSEVLQPARRSKEMPPRLPNSSPEPNNRRSPQEMN
jgi:SAM-dependent methyltransferase